MMTVNAIPIPDVLLKMLWYCYLVFSTHEDQSRPQIFIPLALQVSVETAKTIHKILVDDLIFENLQFYSIEKLIYI
jgi:hypothetical protein